MIDAGRIVNQKAARSQIVGGVIFGIGQALSERARVEAATGRIANTNLMDYLLPELGAVGAAAAIANAIYNATGRRVRELPITVDKLR